MSMLHLRYANVGKWKWGATRGYEKPVIPNQCKNIVDKQGDKNNNIRRLSESGELH